MNLGDWIATIITWASFIGGAYALIVTAWRKWGLRAFVLHILSSYQPAASGTQNASLADTYQAEPPAEPLASTAGTRHDQAIAVLASLTDEDGSYTYSANKIAEFVGGTRAETLAKIRAARGQPDPAPDPSTLLRVRDQAGERLISR